MNSELPPTQRRYKNYAALPALGALLLVVSGCNTPSPQQAVPTSCPPAQTCPSCPSCPAPRTESDQPVATQRRAQWSDLPGWKQDMHADAWPAFLKSCRVLTSQQQWTAVCNAASRLGANISHDSARQFFEAHFEPWQLVNADGKAEGLVTGYYEPLISGSRERTTQARWPIHAPPRDMLNVDLVSTHAELKGMRLRGRLEGNRVVPYWTRAEINRLGDALPADVLLWANDPVDLFFLQVQGSGQVELPDGSRVRVGYADQNGHPYQSIGRWLVSIGALSLDQASMQNIRQWAQTNPHRLDEMLGTNPSYVFFREMPGNSEGPIGALNVPLTEGRSVAVDPRTLPLGAPLFLSTTYPREERPLRRLVMAQDTGGAIKGAVRIDYFWGFGAAAGEQAGKMRQQGNAWVLLPRNAQP